MAHPEEEIDSEYEGMSVTRGASVRETKDVKEAADDGWTEVYEVIGKFIKRG